MAKSKNISKGSALPFTFRTTICALFPGNKTGLDGETCQVGNQAYRVGPENLEFVLTNLHRLVTGDGKLELRFENCKSFAAPALLFRLKREGFSSCAVVASGEGLLLKAVR